MYVIRFIASLEVSVWCAIQETKKKEYIQRRRSSGFDLICIVQHTIINSRAFEKVVLNNIIGTCESKFFFPSKAKM